MLTLILNVPHAYTTDFDTIKTLISLLNLVDPKKKKKIYVKVLNYVLIVSLTKKNIIFFHLTLFADKKVKKLIKRVQ